MNKNVHFSAVDACYDEFFVLEWSMRRRVRAFWFEGSCWLDVVNVFSHELAHNLFIVWATCVSEMISISLYLPTEGIYTWPPLRSACLYVCLYMCVCMSVPSHI